MLRGDQFIRYSRQIMLPEVGEKGVNKLLNSEVIIVGAGGLGTLVSQYLSAAGVGNITIIDNDKVELSNLPRQLLFNHNDINKFKVNCVKKRLNHDYPDVKVNEKNQRVTEINVDKLFYQHSPRNSVVVDCSDNFATRILINRVAYQQNLPLVCAAITKFNGQIVVTDNNQMSHHGCYQCLLPENLNETRNCDSFGVLGPLVGVIASMQAWIVMQYLLQLSFPSGFLFQFDGLNHQWVKARLNKNPRCSVCSNK